MDFIPGVRGKSGHIVGISDFTPRFFFGGPLVKNKLDFSEEFTYEVNKAPVRGLAWPHNETKEQGLDSYSSIQYILSPRHLLSANINIFPLRREFADINSLVPQTASSNYGQRGFSAVINDSYQFESNVLLDDTLKFMQFSAYAHGQGPQDMLLSPEGWRGNFFNAWTREAEQEEALSTLHLPAETWFGRHQVQAGVAFLHRSYAGTSVSHPVELVRENGAAATISFLPAGSLSTQDTDIAGFIQDHWARGQHLAVEMGSRLTRQSIGRRAAYAPRAGAVFSPGASGKTIIRVGAGIFYDRPPLLGGDFSENPTRILTLFGENGIPPGVPTVFHNVYLANGSVRLLGGGSDDLGTSPRNFTWNVEVDRELRRDIALRVSYLYSETQQLFIVSPLAEPPGRNSLLELAPGGGSHYQQFEAALRIHPTELSFLNIISYVHSRARGDLNTLADIFNPFEAPVIRPDFTADLNSDVPNRLISWGALRLPWKLTLSPVVDLHTGFPFSKVDVLQNYVGSPNSQRFPTFFSPDVKLYRDFDVRLPFFGRMKTHRLRLGFYSLNVTNHYNPHDVFNNVASPNFGHFVGFEHRVDGMVIDVIP